MIELIVRADSKGRGRAREYDPIAIIQHFMNWRDGGHSIGAIARAGFVSMRCKIAPTVRNTFPVDWVINSCEWKGSCNPLSWTNHRLHPARVKRLYYQIVAHPFIGKPCGHIPAAEADRMRAQICANMRSRSGYGPTIPRDGSLENKRGRGRPPKKRAR